MRNGQPRLEITMAVCVACGSKIALKNAPIRRINAKTAQAPRMDGEQGIENAKFAQKWLGGGAEVFGAGLVTRKRRLVQQRNPPAGTGKEARTGGARRSRAHNRHIIAIFAVFLARHRACPLLFTIVSAPTPSPSPVRGRGVLIAMPTISVGASLRCARERGAQARAFSRAQNRERAGNV